MGSPPPVVHDLPDSPFSSPGMPPAGLPNIDESAVALDASPPLQPQADEHRATSIMWLGSSCGNYTREEAVDFLRNIEPREGDTMLIGIDGCADGPRIETAYNDPEVRFLSAPSSLEGHADAC